MSNHSINVYSAKMYEEGVSLESFVAGLNDMGLCDRVIINGLPVPVYSGGPLVQTITCVNISKANFAKMRNRVFYKKHATHVRNFV